MPENIDSQQAGTAFVDVGYSSPSDNYDDAPVVTKIIYEDNLMALMMSLYLQLVLPMSLQILPMLVFGAPVHTKSNIPASMISITPTMMITA